MAARNRAWGQELPQRSDPFRKSILCGRPGPQGPGSPGSRDAVSVRAAVRRRPPEGCAAARSATSAQRTQPSMTPYFLMDHFFMEDAKFFLLAFNTLLNLTPPCLCNLFCPQTSHPPSGCPIGLFVNSSSFIESSRSPGSLPFRPWWCLSHTSYARSPKAHPGLPGVGFVSPNSFTNAMRLESLPDSSLWRPLLVTADKGELSLGSGLGSPTWDRALLAATCHGTGRDS